MLSFVLPFQTDDCTSVIDGGDLKGLEALLLVALVTKFSANLRINLLNCCPYPVLDLSSSPEDCSSGIVTQMTSTSFCHLLS